ncbi:MAG: LON peptidase substrate-binding domain-containing protein, partial [Proteobacteria bacterium]|nr:LON peptidase substrate-binding domain-containing protein [Pseudomonadota bacterium]
LLPGGLMPLHVFEPRYRELARDCLDGHQLIGVARLRPGYEASYYGRPPVYECFGVGRIICSEELPDGRFVLLLKGVARVELDRELPGPRAYRTAAVRRLDDTPVDAGTVRDQLQRLVALCDRLAEVLDQGGSQLKELVRSAGDPGECADAVAAALVMDADARQELLEARCPLTRIQRTMGHVGHLLCELAPGPETVN